MGLGLRRGKKERYMAVKGKYRVLPRTLRNLFGVWALQSPPCGLIYPPPVRL